MATIVVTAANVAVVFPRKAEIFDYIAAEALTAGEVVYLNSSGLVALADANASGLEQAVGLTLKAAAAGEAVSVLQRGRVSGFTLGNPGTYAYLGDTPGIIQTSASGTKTVICGRVVNLSDKPNYTKCLFVDFQLTKSW